MTDRAREALPWLTTFLTACVLASVLWAFKGIEELKIQTARLETTIAWGMQDRFTGQQGKSLTENMLRMEAIVINHENRIDAIESNRNIRGSRSEP